MQGVQGHVHGGAGVRRAVDGGGQAEQAGQTGQAEQPKGRGRKKRKKHKHGAAGQGAAGAQAIKGGGAGATAIPGGGGMAGCPMGMTGAATLGTTAPSGALPAGASAAGLTDSQTATAAGAVGTTAPAASTALALGAPAAAPSPLVQSALSQVGGSQLATQVLQSLATNGAQIETVSDAQMASEFGERTKGAFDPRTNRITLPASVAKDPAQLRLVLFHEGVHWLQDNVQGGAEALGGPIGQALQSAGAVRQTAPGKADLQHDEAQAYVLEAKLANELGIRDNGLGVDSAGRALSYDAVLQRVKQTAEYA